MSKTVKCLNTAFEADPNAIHALIVNRVPCNKALADHPDVVVDNPPVIEGEHYSVGALGLVNGILTANGLPRVGAKFEPMPSDQEGRFKIVGFAELSQGRPEEPDEIKSPCSVCETASGEPTELRKLVGPCDTCVDKQIGDAVDKFVRTEVENCTKAAIESVSTKPLMSIEDLWEFQSHLQLLRADEASQVTFTFRDLEQPADSQECVEIKDLWTDWLVVDFYGASVLECLRKAVETRKSWYADQRAKQSRLLRGT